MECPKRVSLVSHSSLWPSTALSIYFPVASVDLCTLMVLEGALNEISGWSESPVLGSLQRRLWPCTFAIFKVFTQMQNYISLIAESHEWKRPDLWGYFLITD